MMIMRLQLDLSVDDVNWESGNFGKIGINGRFGKTVVIMKSGHFEKMVIWGKAVVIMKVVILEKCSIWESGHFGKRSRHYEKW